jgi:hypothetical protein
MINSFKGIFLALSILLSSSGFAFGDNQTSTCPGSPVTVKSFSETPNWNNCIGTLNIGVAYTYEGEFQNRARTGHGRMTIRYRPIGKIRIFGSGFLGDLKIASIYEGQFKNGEYRGYGELTDENGKVTKGMFVRSNMYLGYSGEARFCGTFEQCNDSKEKVLASNAQFGNLDFLKLSDLQKKQLQFGLKNLGYYKSSIDGAYGPKTQRAVRSYAKRRQITSGYPLSIYRNLLSEVNVPTSFPTQKNVQNKTQTIKSIKEQKKISTSVQKQTSGVAQHIITRDKSAVGLFLKVNIDLNGFKVGSLRPGQTISIKLPAGKTTLTTSMFGDTGNFTFVGITESSKTYRYTITSANQGWKQSLCGWDCIDGGGSWKVIASGY